MASTTLLSDNGVTSGITGYTLTGGNDGALQLQTTTAGGTATTAVTINNSQNVGVGTSSPASKLHTAGTGTTAITVSNASAGTTGSPQLTQMNFLGYNNESRARLEAIDVAGSTNGSQLRFYTANTSNTLTQQAVIDSSGNVGIGTSSPVSKLDVSDVSRVRWAVNGSEVSQLATNAAANAYAVQNYDALYHSFKLSSSEAMRIDSSGNLLVGTTSAIGSGKVGIYRASLYYSGDCLALQDGDATTGGAFVSFKNQSATNIGTISRNGASTVAYNTSSDYRLKENIVPMTGALSVVQQLSPVTYTWKEDGESGQGFIAHELQAVVPECVTGEKDAVDADGNPKYQGIDTSFLVATLTAAIQEQQAIIEQLKARLDAANL